jgi:hypothetical protein
MERIRGSEIESVPVGEPGSGTEVIALDGKKHERIFDHEGEGIVCRPTSHLIDASHASLQRKRGRELGDRPLADRELACFPGRKGAFRAPRVRLIGESRNKD